MTVTIHDDIDELSECEHSGDFGSDQGRTKEGEETRSLSTQSSERSSVDGVSAPLFLVWRGHLDGLIAQFIAKDLVEAHKEKSVTHSESTVYPYNSWQDVSSDYPPFSKYAMTALTLDKTYCFENDATEQHYQDKKRQFLEKNNFDEFQSFQESVQIRGFSPKLMIKRGDATTGAIEGTPFWCTVGGYWLFSVFLCSIYPRYKCATLCGRESWDIRKTISI